jgi:hypothetical protein
MDFRYCLLDVERVRKLTAKWIISYRGEGVPEIIRFDGLGQIIYGVKVGLPRNKFPSNKVALTKKQYGRSFIRLCNQNSSGIKMYCFRK